MPLSQDEILNTARLAHVALPEEDIAAMSAAVNELLAQVQPLVSLDTGDTPPLIFPLPPGQERQLELHADEPTGPQDLTLTQRSAPAVDSGLFLVPRVIE